MNENFFQFFKGGDAPINRTSGSAYSQIIRNARGEIIALYPLMPDRMTVNRDENGQLYYEYYMNTDDAHTMKGTTVRLQPHDVLHIPGLGFDGLVGYRVLQRN